MDVRRRNMPSKPKHASIPADRTKWSEKSQRTLSAEFIREYKDRRYQCWQCRAEAVFTAADQRYTYEVKKAPIDQQRILCEACWRRSITIKAELSACGDTWEKSQGERRSDIGVLKRWLGLLEEQEEYIPYKPDSAKKNMLRKLIGGAEEP